jgi:DNA-binding NarL/FixJ family response regulator
MRVVLAEDLYLLRTGLERLLQAHGFDVIESVDNGPALLRTLIHQRPDVAVVDVRLPPTFTDEGLKAAIEARRQVPGLPVLVLSQYVEQLYARELLADQAGAVGYLLKDRVFNDDQFTDAIRAVARGGTVMDPEVVGKLMGRRSRDAPIARLTQRLSVSEKAVGKHSTSIFAKLDLAPSEDDNRRVLAVLAYLNS